MKKKIISILVLSSLLIGCGKEDTSIDLGQIIQEEVESFTGNISGTVDVVGETAKDTVSNSAGNDTSVGSLTNNGEDVTESKLIIDTDISKYKSSGQVSDINTWTSTAMSPEFQAYMQALIINKSPSLSDTIIEDKPNGLLCGRFKDSDLNKVLLYDVIKEMHDLGYSTINYSDLDEGFNYLNPDDKAIVNWYTLDDMLQHVGFTRDAYKDWSWTYDSWYRIDPKYEFSAKGFSKIDEELELGSSFKEQFIAEEFTVKFGDGAKKYYVIIPGATTYRFDEEIMLYAKRGEVKSGDDWVQIVKSDKALVYCDFSILFEECGDNPILYISDSKNTKFDGFKGVIINPETATDGDIAEVRSYLKDHSTYEWSNWCIKNNIETSGVSDEELEDLFAEEENPIRDEIRLAFMTDTYNKYVEYYSELRRKEREEEKRIQEEKDAKYLELNGMTISGQEVLNILDYSYGEDFTIVIDTKALRDSTYIEEQHTYHVSTIGRGFNSTMYFTFMDADFTPSDMVYTDGEENPWYGELVYDNTINAWTAMTRRYMEDDCWDRHQYEDSRSNEYINPNSKFQTSIIRDCDTNNVIGYYFKEI